MVSMGFTTGHGPIRRVIDVIKNGVDSVRGKISKKKARTPTQTAGWRRSGSGVNLYRAPRTPASDVIPDEDGLSADLHQFSAGASAFGFTCFA